MANRTTITNSQLGFNNIKTSLRNYLDKQDEFSDYNFEGSALSSLLDVLSYNTHLNGLITNFALNETFLNTAQLRSSVVNIAAGLGYTPRSAKSAIASLRITANLAAADTRPEYITLAAGAVFDAKVGTQTFHFTTTEEYIGYDNDGLGIYTFQSDNGTSIDVIEGTRRTKTFLVDTVTDDSQIYVLTDSNVDLSTLKVYVYDNINSDSYEEYTNINTLSTIDENSTFYYVNETYNGFYELNFGVQATLGKAPEPGNVIRVSYVAPSGSNANGIRTFTTSEKVTVGGQGFLISVTTVTPSALGDEKESIESIRINAPVSYAAQRRLVTADDYVGVISNSIQGIKSINAWGGEDNVPAKYGKVILSVIFEDDVSTSNQAVIQQKIVDEVTDKFSIISIDTEFTEPEYSYIDINAQVFYNENLTGLTNKALESIVRNTISTYFNEQTGKFNDIFRKSRLISRIDDTESSILSSVLTANVAKRLYPTLARPNTVYNYPYDYTITYLNPIKVPTSVGYTVISDSFVYGGQICQLTNVIGSTQLQIVDLLGSVVVNNIGYYDPAGGVVYLQGFLPDSIVSGKGYIKISTVPSSDAVIKPLRNSVLTLGTTTVTASPDVNKANSLIDQASIISTLSNLNE